MKITKQHIANGVIRFLNEDTIDKIPDVAIQIMLGAVAYELARKPDILDTLLDNPAIAMFFDSKEDGTFDVNALASLQESMERHGNLDIIIPPIKFLSNKEHILELSPSDIMKIKKYIGGNDNG